MIIYFVRHGETEWNKKKIVQGHKDSSLTLKGRRNAEKLGRILRTKNIEIIYSSDLGRCVQTSKTINRWLKVKVIRAKELRERNFGDFNGLPNRKVKEMLDLNNPDERAPNGESFNGQKKRVISFIKKLAEKKFKKILLVIHDGTARAILSEHYNAKFNSKRCDTSDDKIYSIKINNKKI
ncbi:MAG: histidine phosphatase family protein [Parcubacteria group bacterium]